MQAAWVGRAEGFIVHSLKSLGLGVWFVEKLLYACAVWVVLVPHKRHPEGPFGNIRVMLRLLENLVDLVERS